MSVPVDDSLGLGERHGYGSGKAQGGNDSRLVPGRYCDPVGPARRQRPWLVVPCDFHDHTPAIPCPTCSTPDVKRQGYGWRRRQRTDGHLPLTARTARTNLRPDPQERGSITRLYVKGIGTQKNGQGSPDDNRQGLSRDLSLRPWSGEQAERMRLLSPQWVGFQRHMSRFRH